MTRLASLTAAALAALLIAAAPAFGAYSWDQNIGWGQQGSGAGQFSAPGLIAVGPDGSVYVPDVGNARIQKFTSDGAFLTQWGSSGSGPGQFNSPNAVAVGINTNVYVSDSGNSRVQQFDADGNFIFQWGTPGAGPGQFNGIAGIATGPDGSVYVADVNNDRIEKFLSDGTYLQDIVSGAPGGFGTLAGVAVDQDGFVYAVDSANFRVHRFNSDGSGEFTWGSQGSGDGQFLNPQGVAASPAGVYVADPTLGQIEKFTSSGAFVDRLDASAGDPSFGSPTSVAISSAGLIYVLGGTHIGRYTESGGANLPPPQTGSTANVQVVSGTVRIKQPGGGFVTLTDAAQVKIGSIIDVTKGQIDLTTTSDTVTTQTARFYAGVFKLTQPKTVNPVTELQLFGSNFKRACGTTSRRASISATRKKKVVRQLWGVGSGKFRTKGRYSSAAIRGTQWLTQDRCDGTVVRVTEGSVTVRDIPKKKNVVVNAPNSYLAKAPVPKRR